MDPEEAGEGRTAAGSVDPEWILATLAGSTDLVLAIDATTTIRWCNAVAGPLLGHDPAAVIGRSFADFVHPDDVVRAAEVIDLWSSGAFDDTPITPALYRVRRHDDTWVELEVNASLGPDGSMVVVGRYSGDLVTLDRLLEAVSGGAPFEEQVALVLELARWRHPHEGYMIVYRGEHGEPRSITVNVPFDVHGPSAPEGASPWEAAIGLGTELVITDLDEVLGATGPVDASWARAARRAGFLGCLAVPVTDPGHGEGACIVVWTSIDGPTTSGHRYAMSNMTRALALVLQQREQLSGFERATRIDPLTGTASRARFLELLGQLGEEAGPDARHALLYIDLDDFKSVNDNHGHATGDLVLRVTAARIADAAGPDAVVGRLGGDEFSVLCPPATTQAQAEVVAQSIVEVVAQPVAIGGGTAEVGASVGVAVGLPGDHPAVVLDAADVALLAAKGSGRGRWSGREDPVS